MKIQISSPSAGCARAIFAASLLLAGAALAQPVPPAVPPPPARTVIAGREGSGKADEVFTSGASSSGRSVIKIESIDLDRAKEPAREVTWLGLSTGEVPEALAAQLGLKPGQGLVVDFVAPDSPAANAGIQRFDVIDALNDQMLVDPAQLRKLVQMQKDGDTVQLSLYRGGKKETVAATLAKRAEAAARFAAEAGAPAAWPGLARGGQNGTWIFENRTAPQVFAGMNKQVLNAEMERNLEEARKAIQEALRESGLAVPPRAPQAPVPPQPPLAKFGGDSTVTVTQSGASMKTVVKRDEAGDIVIVASPKKRLTAHDAAGKLLFDGEIETPEQQKKVPADLWKKVKALLPQVKPAEAGELPPSAQAEKARAPAGSESKI
jgi:hypothetical protein